jgi:Protein of unknown function, DUF624
MGSRALAEVWLIVRQSLGDLWNDLWSTAVINLAWLICQALVIPGPPATLALFYYGNRLAHGEIADLRDFWHTLRYCWRPAWRWGVVNLALFFLLVGDVRLTGGMGQSPLARFGQSFYLAALGGWFLLQLYALPFLIEQEQASLRLALRNAALMIGRNPAFSFGLMVLLGLTLAIGTLFFLFSVAGGAVFVAIAGNRAVLNRIVAQQRLAEENEAMGI